VSELLYATGDPVPDAGSDGVPEDAEWTKFGVPAIDELGEVAFAGKWVSSEGSGGGIYHTDAGMLVLIRRPGAGSWRRWRIGDP
jgi:hypothetical protein